MEEDRVGQLSYGRAFEKLASASSTGTASVSKSDAGRGVDCFPMPDQSSQQGCANDATRDRVLPGPEICSPQSSGRSRPPSHCDEALLHGRGVGQLSDGRVKKRVRGSGKNNLSTLLSSSSDDDNLCRTVVASNEPKLHTKDGLFDFFNGGFKDGLFTANLFVSATSVVLYPCRVDR